MNIYNKSKVEINIKISLDNEGVSREEIHKQIDVAIKELISTGRLLGELPSMIDDHATDITVTKIN